jgi:hypothetical protein
VRDTWRDEKEGPRSELTGFVTEFRHAKSGDDEIHMLSGRVLMKVDSPLWRVSGDPEIEIATAGIIGVDEVLREPARVSGWFMP